MGNHPAIDHDLFPAQSSALGRLCRVTFHYRDGPTMDGIIVRFDADEPFEVIIALDDGRIVRGAECQFAIYVEGAAKLG